MSSPAARPNGAPAPFTCDPEEAKELRENWNRIQNRELEPDKAAEFKRHSDAAEVVIRALTSDEEAEFDRLNAAVGRLQEESMRRMMAGGRAYGASVEFLKMTKAMCAATGELEVFLEKCRARQVVRAFEEENPPVLDECPICFEDVRLADLGSYITFVCCGKLFCTKCADGFEQKSAQKVCPFCRTPPNPIVDNKKLMIQDTEECAKRGISWAQYNMGIHMHDEKKHAEAVKWFLMAAEQGYAEASCRLMDLYFNGCDSAIEQDFIEAKRWRDKAVRDGSSFAQCELAKLLEDGSGGESQDLAASLRYHTIAAEGGCSDSETILGTSYFQGTHLFTQMDLAKYWLERAAGKGDAYAQCYLAGVLPILSEEQYGCDVYYPGYSPFPRAMWLATQASVNGCEVAMEMIDDIDEQIKSCCSNCLKPSQASPATSFKRCTRCKAAYYCEKKCQLQHWKKGHKSDCLDLMEIHKAAKFAEKKKVAKERIETFLSTLSD